MLHPHCTSYSCPDVPSSLLPLSLCTCCSLFLLECPFPISSADQLLLILQFKWLGLKIFPIRASIDYLGFLTAWGPDSKSEHPQRTRCKSCYFHDLALEVVSLSQAHSNLRGESKDLTSQRDGCPSHIIRRACAMEDGCSHSWKI